ncbi:MAG: ornithine cyclodeaminase family protein [Acidobacteriota bacterium]|nr:ornithine cyclodeaminase family protein [Acidobacteriota bacterium]
MPILLDEHDVRQLLPMADLIDAMEGALAAFSTGKVRQPVRSVVDLPAGGFFAVMPAALVSPAAAGAKLVTVVAANHARGLPSHLATIVLLDAETGALEAIVDGRYITEARTAAVSAVSARHLARKDSQVVAIIGSGVQARSHADALSRVLTLREFRVWSPAQPHRERGAREIESATGVATSASPSPRDAVEGADIVVLVTSATEPVVEDAWIEPSAHIIAVGACRPAHREMPAALVSRAHLVVDSRDAAMQEAGDILLARSEGVTVTIAAELGEICAGTAKGRGSSTGVTIFKSLGLAVEDLVAAELVARRAKATGVGRTFSF